MNFKKNFLKSNQSGGTKIFSFIAVPFDLVLLDTVINLKNSPVFVSLSLSLCICIAVPFDLVLPASGGEVMN